MTKEGQHFQRFMLAFRRVCPEAFAELQSNILLPWLEVDPELSFIAERFTNEVDDLIAISTWLLPKAHAGCVSAKAAGDIQSLRKWIAIAEGFGAFVSWHVKYNLYEAIFATDFLISVFMHWQSDEALRRDCELWVSLIEEYRPSLKPGKKPTPPEYRPYSPIEAYLKAAESYAKELQEWHERSRPSVFAKLYMDIKPTRKSNPLHYECAVLYHCLEMSPDDICNAYPSVTTDKAVMLSYVKRTLEACLIVPRQGKAGAKRNNDALFARLADSG